MVLLDTNVPSEVVRKQPTLAVMKALRALRLQERHASKVTRYELRAGAAKLRVESTDLFIAATAQVHGLIVAPETFATSAAFLACRSRTGFLSTDLSHTRSDRPLRLPRTCRTRRSRKQSAAEPTAPGVTPATQETS